MKIKYKIAIIAAAFLSSVCVSAQDVVLNKQAKDNNDGTYTLTLESYITGEEIKSREPLDIVLVLDNSNSMYAYNVGSTSTKRAVALKNAVKAFLDQLLEDSDGLQHQVAIVKFQGGGRRIYSYLTSDASRATDICGKWIQMNDEDIQTAKDAVDAMHSAEKDDPKDTGTPAADGLFLANTLISAPGIADDDRKKVIIFFTDGCCGTGETWGVTDTGHNGNSQSYDHDWGYNNGTVIPNRYYAQYVVDEANLLKKKATIFCVGTFGDLDNTQKGDTYFYLRHVSSEYSTSIHVSGTIPETPITGKITSDLHPTPGDAADAYNNPFVSVDVDGYDKELTIGENELIFDAASSDALNNAFQSILSTIVNAPDLNSETAVVLDAMSDKFRLPAETITDNTKIKVYTCDAASATPTWTMEGGKEKWVALEGGKVVVNPETSVAGEIESDVVEVSGFDFKANYVGIHSDTPRFFGRKLIIQFDIIPEPSNPGGIAQMITNDARSGIYVKGDDGTYSAIDNFEQPNVYLPYIKIIKKGLGLGESATFKITKAADNGVDNGYDATVVITKTSATVDPYAVLKLVYSGEYTVKELDWAWAYDRPLSKTVTIATTEYTDDVTDPFVSVTFENTNMKTSPEHDESYVINNMNVSRQVGDAK